MDPNRFNPEELLNRPVLTEEEARWLLQHIATSEASGLRTLLLEKFADDLAGVDAGPLPNGLSDKMLGDIRETLAASSLSEKKKRFAWTRVAAAVLILVLGSVAYLLLRPVYTVEPPLAKSGSIHTDVAAPVATRATITLGDGRQIVLDSNRQGNGMLASEGDVLIERTADGAIAYKGTTAALVYNTLLNPRGSKPVSLTLSDGSKVWLNSESSLRYPVSFSGKERTVEITGEAYFEVQKNPAMPFRVSIGGTGSVEVLGTHFNINSYGDEAHTRITLLEGSVRVTVPAAKPVVIAPGQQAYYTNGTRNGTFIDVKPGVDLDAVMAWKNGYFNFDQADLYTVMRQLSRWYNITIRYEGKMPSRVFGGEMQRDLNLSEVLKLLEKNNIHFRIENDQLFVRP